MHSRDRIWWCVWFLVGVLLVPALLLSGLHALPGRLLGISGADQRLHAASLSLVVLYPLLSVAVVARPLIALGAQRALAAVGVVNVLYLAYCLIGLWSLATGGD
jgi:hypothetical protein